MLLSCSVLAVSAEDQQKHRIDVEHEKCLSLAENQSTHGMIHCANEAYGRWDRELNVVYKKLMNALDAGGREKLKRSQVAWLQYRDLEFAHIDAVHKNLEGTMYQPIRVNNRVRIVRDRVLELSAYLELLGS